MKLVKLEIHNFRGIKNLKIEPNGNNFLIWGPNGSGKSAVVDSIDFLLTGNISRMTGKGTKGITLKKHGPHVDYSAEDSEVSAVIKIHDMEEPIELKRSLDKPNNLICDENLKNRLKPILEMASRGQHVLTRREILNYVNADASTRGKQIQTLLKIIDVDQILSKLRKVTNTLKNEYQAAEGSHKTFTTALVSNIGINEFDKEKIIDFININRKILDGNPLEDLNSNELKEGIEPHKISIDIDINTQILKTELNKLQKITSKENVEKILKINNELRELKDKLSSDQTKENALNNLKLSKLGLELVDSKNICPLCDKPWNSSDLKEHLQNKLEVLKDANNNLDRILQLSEDLILEINHVIGSLNEIITSTEILELKYELDILTNWLNKLKLFLKAIENDDYPNEQFRVELVQKLFAPADLIDVLGKIYSKAIERSPEPSEEQTAWDTLTRLEENLKNYEKSIKDCSKSFKSYNKSQILLNTFIESRNKILDKLYGEIKNRFVELYKELHGIDEIKFDAIIVSEGAGVDFKVDFHGRGINPPHALHSEGHQDSMGICLYLALAERLTKGYIDLRILDDVMMSVDAPHRREICHLLANFFKGRQFFITTHDQTWARQLQSEGVVRARNRIEFSNWTIENGPSVNIIGDTWDKIDEDLKKNDVPSAAAKLRRSSEEYFSQVCAALNAPVRFKFNGQYELGDLMSGAMSEYKRQIKHAKTAARFWENYDEMERLRDTEEYSKNIFDRTNMERWAVNPALHYNQWADFTAQDFKPVVETFHELFSIFICDNCGTLLHLVNGPRPEAVKCNCGNINWNLIDK